jgi:hypothetical protein
MIGSHVSGEEQRAQLHCSGIGTVRTNQPRSLGIFQIIYQVVLHEQWFDGKMTALNYVVVRC